MFKPHMLAEFHRAAKILPAAEPVAFVTGTEAVFEEVVVARLRRYRGYIYVATPVSFCCHPVVLLGK